MLQRCHEGKAEVLKSRSAFQCEEEATSVCCAKNVSSDYLMQMADLGRFHMNTVGTHISEDVSVNTD